MESGSSAIQIITSYSGYGTICNLFDHYVLLKLFDHGELLSSNTLLHQDDDFVPVVAVVDADFKIQRDMLCDAQLQITKMAEDTCYCEKNKQQCYDPATKNDNPLLTGLCETLKAYGDPLQPVYDGYDGYVYVPCSPADVTTLYYFHKSGCALCRTACNHIPDCVAVEIDLEKWSLGWDTCSCSFAYAWYVTQE